MISKKRSFSQKCHEIRCQSTKKKYRWQTLIWASICTSVAPSLFISSGQCPRLGGRNFHLGGAQFLFGRAQAVNWGGTVPECPPWRRAWSGWATTMGRLLSANVNRKKGQSGSPKNATTLFIPNLEIRNLILSLKSCCSTIVLLFAKQAMFIKTRDI